MGNQIIGFKQPNIEWFDTVGLIKNLEEKEIKARIGVNAEYLQDALKHVHSCSGNYAVVLEVRERDQAIIARSGKDKRNIRMVMPMKFRDWED